MPGLSFGKQSQNRRSGLWWVPIVLIVISVMLITLCVRFGNSGPFAVARGVVQTVTKPVERVCSLVSTPFSNIGAIDVDEEVARLMTTAHDTAYSILSENSDQLELMAQVLLERETVEGRAVEALLDNTWDEYVEWEKTHPSEAEQDKKNILTAAQNVGAPHELMDPRDASDAPAPVSPPAPDSDDGGR